MKGTIVYRIIFILFVFCQCLLGRSEVIKYKGAETDLGSRWQWAEKQTGSFRGGFWAGYSITKMMGENSSIGSHSGHEGFTSLAIFIEGSGEKSSSEGTLKDAVRKALEQFEESEKDETIVPKELALLFYFDDNQLNWDICADVKISNLSLSVNLKKRPLVWLGHAGQEQSFKFLEDKYNGLNRVSVREDLILAVSQHEKVEAADGFLQNIIRTDENSELRESAVFWLGQRDSEENVVFLMDVVRSDRSTDVREKAVFSISQMDLESATDALIGFARSDADQEVQEKAIFWLGQQASEKALETLQDITYDDESLEIKEKAVFALAQFSDNEGIPALIKIAKTHPSKNVRKKAIFWLGQSGDERAVEAIIEIVQNSR